MKKSPSKKRKASRKLLLKSNLSKILEVHQITQTELAQLLGVPLSTVNRWVRGNRVPRRNTLFRIAKVLRVKPKELIKI